MRILLKLRPADTRSSLYRSMVCISCFLTSWARFMERDWMKFSKHQGLLNLEAFHASYTASRVRWSPSAWKNFAFFWSACAPAQHMLTSCCAHALCFELTRRRTGQ